MISKKFSFIKSGYYDVVILDDLHQYLFEIITKHKNVISIPIRNKIPIILNIVFFFNLFIFILKNKFNKKKIRKNYLIFFFKYINTKKVFTFYENTHRIELLKKKFPKINFYTFPNGTRVPNYEYKHDIVISWGRIDKEIDNRNKKYLSNKYFDLGSLRLLNYKLIRTKHKKNIDLIYISGFSTVSSHKNNTIFSLYNLVKRYERILLKILISLKNKHRIRIKILMKNEFGSEDFVAEKNYLKNFFKDHEILVKKNFLDGYRFIEKSKVTLSLISAMGLEALSLDTKVLLGFPVFKSQGQIKIWKKANDYSKYLKDDISFKYLSKDNLYYKIKKLNKLNNSDYLNLIQNARKSYSKNPNLNQFNKIIYEN
jgi:surface carbohydrate biosynthesis protein